MAARRPGAGKLPAKLLVDHIKMPYVTKKTLGGAQNKEWVCPFCSRGLANADSAHTHIRRNALKMAILCADCKQARFWSVRAFNDHSCNESQDNAKREAAARRAKSGEASTSQQ